MRLEPIKIISTATLIAPCNIGMGICEWPIFVEKDKFEAWAVKVNKPELTYPYSNIKNIGPCVVKIINSYSTHCGSEDQCNCYCFNK